MNLARNTNRRSGLSVIEVLTAIVVALIGVSGVLIMIPFAVSQAEIGMDTEKAVDLARNLTEEMEIRGILETAPVVTPPIPIAGVPFIQMTNATARCYCLDPSGVADRIQAGNTSGVFPYIHPDAAQAIFDSIAASTAFTPGTNAASFDQTCLIQRASIADPVFASAVPSTIVPLRKALARAAFSWQDDLQTRAITDPEFANPAVNVGGQYQSKDLMLPIPLFDQTVTATGTVLNARRQSLGEMTAVVISCPAVITPRIRTSPPLPLPTTADFERDGTGSTIATGSYPSGVPSPPSLPDQSGDAADIISETQNFYLVYKRRPSPVLVDDPSTPVPALQDRQNYDRVYDVEWPGNAVTGLNDPRFRVSFNGGMLKLREPGVVTDTRSMAGSNNLSGQRADIRRGDWMALTNVQFDYGTGRYQQNINFYQVEDAFIATDVTGPHWAITLKGPEWDFLRNYQVDSLNGRYPYDPNPANPTTFSPITGAAVIVGGGPLFDYLPSNTLAIHLPDVWTVFERTTRIGD